MIEFEYPLIFKKNLNLLGGIVTNCNIKKGKEVITIRCISILLNSFFTGLSSLSMTVIGCVSDTDMTPNEIVWRFQHSS